MALLSGLSAGPLRPASGTGPQKPVAQIEIDRGHPWRPPFGLQRVGQPLTVVVKIEPDRRLSEYALVGYQKNKELRRSPLSLTGKPPYSCRVSFDRWPTELVLFAKSAAGASVELARRPVEPVPLEADAIARPDGLINPVDLGTVLVPSDWLLLADGQRGSIDVAAICRSGEVPHGRAVAWFEHAPQAKTATDMRAGAGLPGAGSVCRSRRLRGRPITTFST